MGTACSVLQHVHGRLRGKASRRNERKRRQYSLTAPEINYYFPIIASHRLHHGKLVQMLFLARLNRQNLHHFKLLNLSFCQALKREKELFEFQIGF